MIKMENIFVFCRNSDKSHKILSQKIKVRQFALRRSIQ